MPPVPIEQWSDRLQHVLDALDGPLRRVTVLRETGSTQDAAKRMSAEPGDVVVAWRQTAGRGRLGRAWADTGEDGIAVTLVTDAGPPSWLAVASAVGAACAAEALLRRAVGIKWPNDVVVDGRKLAGVLTEQAGGQALIGIGLNV
ncbi:MAG: biotin--[acetyl-CoA-carboxylase] ligase, partial [Planctomycetota bacterium]